MRKSKFSGPRRLDPWQGDAGIPVKGLCRQAGIDPATYY